jgi:hypothetical protein
MKYLQDLTKQIDEYSDLIATRAGDQVASKPRRGAELSRRRRL